MADPTPTPGPWHVEGSWKRPSTNEAGHIITHGINSYGDGPDGNVCRTISTSQEDARLIAAAPDLDAAAGLAITVLGFEQEKAQRDGDEIAFAQITQAKTALIAAQDKARGRGPQMLDITPQQAAIAKATGAA